MRPRELLHFTKECINVAVNRGHDKVSEDDIKTAEDSFSEDILVDVNFELKDINPYYADLLYGFIDSKANLTKNKLIEVFKEFTIPLDIILAMVYYKFVRTYVRINVVNRL